MRNTSVIRPAGYSDAATEVDAVTKRPIPTGAVGGIGGGSAMGATGAGREALGGDVCVGPKVGALVGAPEGAMVGAAVVATVGVLVGAPVGLEVGADVGAAVGDVVGAKLGDRVGATVDIGVCAGDATVGVKVGEEVGAGVPLRRSKIATPPAPCTLSM